MTIAEILKAKGIDDALIKEIQDEMKTQKIFTASEENLDVRYGKLKTQHEGVTQQLTEANALIEELKASNQGNEELQGKITAYEAQIADLTKQLNEQKLDAAMDRALAASGAKPEDFDYLKFQWRKKGEQVLDDNGEIKGGSDAVAGLKTQYPAQFSSESRKIIIENTLPTGDNEPMSVSREQFAKMGYADRLKLKQENEPLYRQYTKN